jgi:diaminohydroxyphosphoribosylaminopyrimidine deaminase/5-amino-6-(5-phosphoribosylamino)uracil reductase
VKTANAKDERMTDNQQPITDNHQQFIRRCFDLARLGAGSVSPNPMVGAVLVFEGKIIGEGWHRKYGEAHAEVNCLASVSPENQKFIPRSTLFCSLEPCFHFGKTPPCVDLILEKKISRVVVANTDPNPLTAGKSLEKLRAAGVEVEAGILEEEGRWLNRVFFAWIAERRPFVILKWAQTSDGFMGRVGERTPISGAAAQRLVHCWRSESDAILVGATTASTDNPRLDARFYFGKNPLRIVFDRQGKMPSDFHLLDDSTETWVFGPERSRRYSSDDSKSSDEFYSKSSDEFFRRTKFFPTEGKILISNLLKQLFDANRASLFVEGGANVLTQFLQENLWDEIRVVENSRHLGGGIQAPKVPSEAILKEQFLVGEDTVRVFARK